MASKFEVGDLVWAKMRGFPAWPGKIIQPKSEVKRPATKKNHHFVFFFGSENYAWVPEETVFSYVQDREKFMVSSRVPKGFKEAVEAIDDAVKAMPDSELLAAQNLPTIDDELAQMFPLDQEPPNSVDEHGLDNDKASDVSSSPVGKKALLELQERLDRWEKMGPSSDKKRKSGNRRKSEGNEKKRRSSALNGEAGPDLKKRKRRKTEEQEPGTDEDEDFKVSPQKPKITSSLKKKPSKAVMALTPSQKIVKKAKAVAKGSSASNLSNSRPSKSPIRSPDLTSPTKIKPRKIPELRPTESDLNPHMLDGHEDLGVGSMSTAGTQIEEGLLVTKTPMKSLIPTPMRIGFLGLGIMGQGMVMNLLRSGHEVTVWNRTIMKCREFVKAGALKGNTPCEVVQSCDITFCCVADTTAVKDLVFGSTGVLQGISSGKCYVEMSTIDEETVQDVAEAIMARGGVYLEAPVVGSRVPALEGQLTILASGDRKLFDDCFSCFEAVGKKSLYLGPEPGAATRMKLIINMMMGTVMASLAEAMAMAEKVGLDQEDVAEVLALGSLACPTVVHKSQAILNQKYDPHFPLQHQQKDLRLALQLGDKVEQPLYVAAAANELYKKARRLGYGDSDISAVFRAASN